jgi:hypothetical protein
MPGLQNIVAALIPMILGMVWFHPKVFGTAWMEGARLKAEDAQRANMPLLMGVGFLMALIISLYLKSYALYHEGTPADCTFTHGMFHGAMIGLMVGIPTMISSSLWEMKSLKFYLIQIAYWVIAYAMMGGLLFAWRSGYAEVVSKAAAGAQ